jgi:hypothetical protein
MTSIHQSDMIGLFKPTNRKSMECPDFTKFNQIVIGMSFVITLTSIMVSFLILIGFCPQKSRKSNIFASLTTWYEYLAQLSIKALISTDFIQGLVYAPLLISQFVQTFFPANRTVSILVLYESTTFMTL